MASNALGSEFGSRRASMEHGSGNVTNWPGTSTELNCRKCTGTHSLIATDSTLHKKHKMAAQIVTSII